MGSFRLVVAKMKRKTTEKVSKYQLIDNDVSQHPTYEQMIQEVLENSKSNTGIRRKTIYHRIKQNYNLEDRYAKPAMNNALKKMRKVRKVKRTIEGLYKKARPKKKKSKKSKYTSSFSSSGSCTCTASTTVETAIPTQNNT